MNGDTYELTIDASPRQASIGQEIRIWGELRLVHEDGTYDPIPNQEIELHVIKDNEDIKYATTVTDDKGQYEFKVKFMTEGTYIIYTMAKIGEEEKPVDYTKYIMAGAAVVGVIIALLGLSRREKK